MAKKIKKFFVNVFSHRVWILLIIFGVMTGILVGRMFNLQIIHGQEYADNFTVKITKERTLKSTRGNIYDVNGKLLAYNELSNSVTLEDNGTYSSNREKNLSLNGEIYQLVKLIESKGDSTISDFHIRVENNQYTFDVGEGTKRDRFRADIYGYKTIAELSPKEASADAEDIMQELAGSNRFAVYNEKNPYTEEELTSHGLPVELSKEEILKIVIIRYKLSLTSYKKYMQITIASNVNDGTVAAIEENITKFPGVAISEESIRVYNDAESMAPVIGYTGSPSEEELEELQAQRDDYNASSIIGKTGIEQYMEITLQGVDGTEEVTVDNLGKVLAINEESRVEPVQGNDVYLTIDSELQRSCYQILEQRIAGILVSNIQPIKTVEESGWTTDSSDPIPIPIYDVYTALFQNSVIDIDHFTAENASYTEQVMYQQFLARRDYAISWLNSEFSGASITPYTEMTDEQKAYMDYVIDELVFKDTKLIDVSTIDSTDPVYQKWINGEDISMYEFFTYAASQNWIDVSQLFDNESYLNSNEIYNTMTQYIVNLLMEDTWFSKLIYKYLILDDQISAADICIVLYDQGVLDYQDGLYEQLISGMVGAYDLIMSKLQNLEIKPKQLALDPCSGSIVIVDPDSGQVRALVTYPGYDNNRLANQMDTDYYWELYNDLSTPFYNKATQQLTAPGSTFKPVTTAAGLTEGVVDTETIINCNGLFGEGLVEKGDQIHCWLKTGHGDLTVTGGIANSCNVYFCTVAYRLGLNEDNEFVQSQSLAYIQEYAKRFNLDQKTNIQLAESTPQISDNYALASSIGQGTHLYTTSELARYAATIENSGTSYDLNLLDKVTDSAGNLIVQYGPNVSKIVELDDVVWETIHTGMRLVITNTGLFMNFPVTLSGKTGTAEESKTRPSHALFIGYSSYDNNNNNPLDDQEDIAFCVRIAYGYSSTNAELVARDMLYYYYNLKSEPEILTGVAATDGISNTPTD